MSDNIDQKLYRAADRGKESLVSQLIGQRGDYGWTALHQAAWRGHTSVVPRLLDAGWSLEARNDDVETPLAVAARNSELETVKCLLLRGANIDTQYYNDKWTPLHRASHCGQTEMIKTLLQCGANQEIRNSKGNTAEDEAKKEETRSAFREFNAK